MESNIIIVNMLGQWDSSCVVICVFLMAQVFDSFHGRGGIFNKSSFFDGTQCYEQSLSLIFGFGWETSKGACGCECVSYYTVTFLSSPKSHKHFMTFGKQIQSKFWIWGKKLHVFITRCTEPAVLISFVNIGHNHDSPAVAKAICQ